MSKRLQVLLPFREYSRFKKIAKTGGWSLGEWVRQALRKMAGDAPRLTVARKLETIGKAARFSAPVSDIGRMLKEIEAGYLES